MENSITTKAYIKEKICATLIDFGIFSSIAGTYIYTVGLNLSADGIYHFKVSGALALPVYALWFLYFVVSEAYIGTTLGQAIFRLSVLKVNGDRIGLREAFLRRLCDFLDLYLCGLPAIILIQKTPLHQRLGDILAGTIVVKSRM